MFCAPTRTAEPSTASATDTRLTDGGQTAMCTSRSSPTTFARLLASATASGTVVFIFQFPAISMGVGVMVGRR